MNDPVYISGKCYWASVIEYTREPVEDFTPVEGGYIQEENIPFN